MQVFGVNNNKILFMKGENMKQRFCASCGNVLGENALFCGKCGVKVSIKGDESQEIRLESDTQNCGNAAVNVSIEEIVIAKDSEKAAISIVGGSEKLTVVEENIVAVLAPFKNEQEPNTSEGNIEVRKRGKINLNLDIFSRFKLNRKMIMGIVIVALISISGFFAWGNFFGGRSNSVAHHVLYADDGQLNLLVDGSSKSIVIDDNYMVNNNRYLKYNNAINTDNLFVYINGGILYFYDISKNEKKQIAASIGELYYFTDDDKFVIYNDANNSNVFAYDIKKDEIRKIVSLGDYESFSTFKPVSNSFIFGVRYTPGQAIGEYTIYKMDLNLDDSKTKIINNVSEVQTNASVGKMLLTLKAAEMYQYKVYNTNSDQLETVIENGYLYDFNADYSEFIYTKNGANSIPLLIDDEAGNDPITTESKLCTYSAYYYGYCSYMEYWYDEYYTSTVSKKDINDTLRSYFENMYVDRYDIYYRNGNKEELLASDVYSVDDADVGSKSAVYKIAEPDNNQVKISELTSTYDYYNVTDNMKLDAYYASISKGEHLIATYSNPVYDVLSNKKGGYYVTDNDGAIYVEYTDSELVKTKITDKDVYYYTLLDDNRIQFTNERNDGFYDIYIGSGAETKLIFEGSYWGWVIYADDKLIAKIENGSNFDYYSYSLKTEKIEILAANVDQLFYVADDKYVVTESTTRASKFDISLIENEVKASLAYDVESASDYIGIVSRCGDRKYWVGMYNYY